MKQYRLIATIAASGLLASFAAQAYEKDMGYEYHREEPKEHRFNITGGATYLVPSMNGLDYATVFTGAGDAASTYNLNPNYNWGYYIEAGYMISNHYDIQASWQQYNSDSSDSLTAAFPADAALVTSDLHPIDLDTPGDTESAHTSETLKTEAFDVTLGQYHKLGKMLTARPFVGVGYAKVDSKTTNTYAGVEAGSDTYNSKFNGWGPELGLDAEYGIWDRLGVVGHVAAAFLIGSQETSSNVFTTPGPAQVAVSTGDDTRMVPTINAKLGLNWNSLYATNSWGVGIEGGYQVAYYYNVVDQVQLDGAEVEHNFDSVGIMGPYLNLSVDF